MVSNCFFFYIIKEHFNNVLYLSFLISIYIILEINGQNKHDIRMITIGPIYITLVNSKNNPKTIIDIITKPIGPLL